MNIYTIDGNGVWTGGAIDEFGKTVERSKSEYPYSYDGFITYRKGKNEEANCTIYSDRILQQDYAKIRLLMKKHFKDSGDYYTDRSPKKIEAFLSEYLEKEVEIIFIMEYCNVSSGYPLWRFDVNVK